MSTKKLTIYQKIVKYGLKVAPAHDEEQHKIVEWQVFSEIEGGYWCDGKTLQEAVEEWEVKHGKV
jgi:hypothetical protein